MSQRDRYKQLTQVMYETFYDYCVDEMVVSSENQLAESLKEAIGHGVD